MCGIFTSIHNTRNITDNYIEDTIINASKLLEHRGPDSLGTKIIHTVSNKTIIMVHTRLHIIGESKCQPIEDQENEIVLIINGEIFNWKELSDELDYKCTQSDCEILIPLYKKYIRNHNNFTTFFEKLNGQFSFVIYDRIKDYLFVSRDHIGITPLYYGYNQESITFCSEMKCLTNIDENLIDIKVFEPRMYLNTSLKNINLTEMKTYLDYYKLTSENTEGYENRQVIKENIKKLLEDSVRCQLNDLITLNVNYGVLLSGGLDSSLIASIISKESKKRNVKQKIRTFSIGVNKDSVDLVNSRTVAKFLDTDHHEFYFTIDEGIDAIKDTIYYTETYDTTTIRASTAMYLLTKKIKTKFPELKVLFSGELSDELLCYVYGSNAPNEIEFKNETLQLVNKVHLFDALRSNKTCMANGIEPRVPFTDPTFVKYILNIPTKYKIFGKLRKSIDNADIMEKQILRDAFDVLDENGESYLPKNILMRRKETFSDAVSTFEGKNKINWIDSIIEYCQKKYDTTTFNIKIERYSYNKPQTKEELWYRELFCSLFNNNYYKNTSELTVEFWKPNWCGNNSKYIDPSARKHIKEIK